MPCVTAHSQNMVSFGRYTVYNSSFSEYGVLGRYAMCNSSLSEYGVFGRYTVCNSSLSEYGVLGRYVMRKAHFDNMMS